MSLDKAYKTSRLIFEQTNGNMLEQLRSITPGEIVVVRGTYDHVEKILDEAKVPYALIPPDKIGAHNGGRVMLVNCGSYSHSPKGLEQFVRDGGRLVTTDWALSLIEHVFPKRLMHTASTGDDVVEIQAYTPLGRTLIGLNYAQCHPKWWLEGSSYVYDIGQKVVPVITSKELAAKYGKPYIAAGFQEGVGEVVHFISHFELQRTHTRTDADSKGLEAFLAKVGATKTTDMDDTSVAELEAAYSSLNTVATLCLPHPLLSGETNSVLSSKSTVTKRSKSLA